MSSNWKHGKVQVGDTSIHTVEAGAGRPVLFLHGWPQSWFAWRHVLDLAAKDFRAIAIDLPGVGASAPATDGTTTALARVVQGLIEALQLEDVTLVGHDAGGMAAYAYLREQPGAARVVVMDTVVPGVAPWDEVLRNPYIWHFAFHGLPSLPEALVQGKQAAYFDFFFDQLAADKSKLTAEARTEYVRAYATDASLTAGFGFYRAFKRDAEVNVQSASAPVQTPLLYLRGEKEGGKLADYERGFHDAGVRNLTCALIPESGHFAPEEAPEAVWEQIRRFIVQTPKPS